MTYKELAHALPSMSPKEVLDAIRGLEDIVFISVDMAGKVCGLGGNTIRLQAREDRITGRDMLGFSCLVAKSRVLVNRKSFLEYVDKEAKP